ncbi:glycosyltransferase [Geodermatophilus sp. SYSU D00758]
MRVLVALWDGGGTVPPEMGVVRRLVARGHEVRVLSDPVLVPQVAATGAASRPWRRAPARRYPGDPDLVDDAGCRTPLQVLTRILDGVVAGPAAAFAADVCEASAEHPADVVVSDGALLGVLAAAESLGVPSVALCPNVYLRPAPELPPFGSGLPPARGPLGRGRDRLLARQATRLWDRGLPALNTARAGLGLPPLAGLWDQWDAAARVLVLTSAAFDLPARLPGNVRYTGPLLDDPGWAPRIDPPAGGGPLVVVGFSTTRQRGTVDVLRRVVAALDRSPVRAVVTTGPHVDPAAVPGGDRVAVVRAAAHGPLLARADAVVTHAGHGTLLKALAAGLPTLCLPLGRDQRDNAVRAVRLGGALRLRPTASPDRIAAAVHRLLTDPRLRADARRAGARLSADAARPELVEQIEAAATARPVRG